MHVSGCLGRAGASGGAKMSVSRQRQAPGAILARLRGALLLGASFVRSEYPFGMLQDTGMVLELMSSLCY